MELHFVVLVVKRVYSEQSPVVAQFFDPLVLSFVVFENYFALKLFHFSAYLLFLGPYLLEVGLETSYHLFYPLYTCPGVL